MVPHSFEEILDEFKNQKVLVLGDLMLDRYVYGKVNRISPEAPTAVIAASRPKDLLGGAANVASNIVGMSARCSVIGVVGEDEAAKRLSELMNASAINSFLIAAASRDTTVKMRFVANLRDTHLLRADWEDISPLDPVSEDAVLKAFYSEVESADVILLSDYKKGVLTARVIDAVIARARSLNIPVVADPKGEDYRRYHGVTTLTPNVTEVSQALGRPVPDDTNALTEAAHQLMASVGCEFILVTRSENGVLLVERSGNSSGFPATAARVVDVSGAGDTLVGCFALALSTGAEPRLAAQLANRASGIGVAKAGTSVVTAQELRGAILSRPNLQANAKIAHDLTALTQTVENWRSAGLSIGFTNGCYDLIHPGHIHVLQQARANCDRLVVGLNTDASVRRLKGTKRPIQDETARAIVMAALSFVDMVVLFDEDTPIELIRRIRPHVLFKGADYSLEKVVGREVVEAEGGRVLLIDLLPENSTTGLVQRINASSIYEDAEAVAKRKEEKQPVHVIARLNSRSGRWLGNKLRPALFLDRDGVIIDDKGYVGRAQDVVLLPNVARAICRANDAGIPVVIASNQSGVARGMFNWGAVNDVDDVVHRLLADEGATLDLVLYCGAGPESDPLECRKPAAGLFHLAERLLFLNLSRSAMVGDQVRDLDAAARAGLRQGILVGPNARTAPALNHSGLTCQYEDDPAQAIETLVRQLILTRDFV
ncbi:D-glycero-beta-D-manno-heptose-7-phosphate kinase [Methylobacterium durans]|uniref:D-glycero-beta-D-manno-heptose-7-phosphate kinase n=1 Tax=Methylobacterium durans TaxID=2202825 RepID=UPI002AFFCCC0|nr:D-glycero-beta-D-manno-heptose-7-phosphate kinase [Methylobacterium durans]MEA1835048.1 D-glycero-beta-D-manno-heptose-7-phosphate kinase [Methylobacterium durans]